MWLGFILFLGWFATALTAQEAVPSLAENTQIQASTTQIDLGLRYAEESGSNSPWQASAAFEYGVSFHENDWLQLNITQQERPESAFQPSLYYGRQFGNITLGGLATYPSAQAERDLLFGPEVGMRVDRFQFSISYLESTNDMTNVNSISSLDVRIDATENLSITGTHETSSLTLPDIDDMVDMPEDIDVDIYRSMLGIEYKLTEKLTVKFAVGKLSLEMFDNALDRAEFSLVYRFRSGPARLVTQPTYTAYSP